MFQIETFKKQKIVCLSGVFENIHAVSKEGRLFGCGSNRDGQENSQHATLYAFSPSGRENAPIGELGEF